ncbi:MAG: TRAP transporter substrate-binding protein DctP [Halobacteriovoraceae bacterium]|nr:TRAP transporter substrate-binding protein DctP [Halobacteriovoraceae bacterium]|tara:strand:- start:1723 stop:2703 length:981 start_codon:yes stop_codon:yes gene_type:complete
MKITLILFILLSSFFILKFGKDSSRKQLVLAHNINKNHPVHRGLEDFAQKLDELSKGKLEVIIYPNAILGKEREILELLQVGALSFTKVSSSSLENFNPLWSVINLPYIFRSIPHSFEVFDGEVGQLLLDNLYKANLQGLAFYNAGARSFYAHKPIREPKDIEGLKIRVMGSQSAINMLKAMGGSPTPMPYGEVYTALQQNVIDGAENNVFALTTKKHGEVAKHYSLDEHAIMPDVLVVSSKLWSELAFEEKQWVQTAAKYSSLQQRKYWNEDEARALDYIQEKMNVTIHYPKKDAFIEKVKVLHDEAAQRGDLYSELISKIKAKD